LKIRTVLSTGLRDGLEGITFFTYNYLLVI